MYILHSWIWGTIIDAVWCFVWTVLLKQSSGWWMGMFNFVLGFIRWSEATEAGSWGIQGIDPSSKQGPWVGTELLSGHFGWSHYAHFFVSVAASSSVCLRKLLSFEESLCHQLYYCLNKFHSMKFAFLSNHNIVGKFCIIYWYLLVWNIDCRVVIFKDVET